MSVLIHLPWLWRRQVQLLLLLCSRLGAHSGLSGDCVKHAQSEAVEVLLHGSLLDQ